MKDFKYIEFSNGYQRHRPQFTCEFKGFDIVKQVVFFLDKVEETTRACDNLLLTWKTHGSTQGDRKVKEIMYSMASRILTEIEQWRENSSTDDTLNSLTSIQTFLEEIKEMNFSILKEEEEVATEYPSILRLLIKEIKIARNKPQIRQWWYDVMTLCPPPLPKHEEKYREEILDRVEEIWQEEHCFSSFIEYGTRVKVSYPFKDQVCLRIKLDYIMGQGLNCQKLVISVNLVVCDNNEFKYHKKT